MFLPSWITFDLPSLTLSGFSNYNLLQFFRIKADDQWGQISTVDFQILYKNDPPSFAS
jgi:hypothetical protein